MNNKHDFLTDKVLLVVDDDPSNRKTLVDLMLQELPSMFVLAANNGAQALQILAKKNVDLILLDWEMPVLNGLDTLQELQQHQVWKNIPVIMYTGAMTAAQNLKLALDLGAVDFLRKPADPIELIARIQSVLTQKKLEEERLQMEKDLLKAQQVFIEKEIKIVKQELSNNLLLLAHKNKVLLDIKERCENTAKDAMQTLHQIAKHIGRSVDEDEYWDDFMKKFHKTDPMFMKMLLEKTPNLSSNEVRVCSLIRFGMNNKDIMSLVNISIEGIKKSRYRIRKKMQLTREESLENYLMSL